MIRRPPRSTRTDNTLSLHDALPISQARDLHERRSRGRAGDPDASEVRPRKGFSQYVHAPRHPASGQRRVWCRPEIDLRSEEHTSELQSLMRISYAVFCLKKKTTTTDYITSQKTLYIHRITIE